MVGIGVSVGGVGFVRILISAIYIVVVKVLVLVKPLILIGFVLLVVVIVVVAVVVIVSLVVGHRHFYVVIVYFRSIHLQGFAKSLGGLKLNITVAFELVRLLVAHHFDLTKGQILENDVNVALDDIVGQIAHKSHVNGLGLAARYHFLLATGLLLLLTGIYSIYGFFIITIGTVVSIHQATLISIIISIIVVCVRMMLRFVVIIVIS